MLHSDSRYEYMLERRKGKGRVLDLIFPFVMNKEREGHSKAFACLFQGKWDDVFFCVNENGIR